MAEIEQTWQKIERHVRKIGLGDGLSRGKDRNFQEDFNKGFSEGFRNAHAIGLYKGTLFAHSKQKNVKASENELLIHPKVAWCEACRDKEFLNKTFPEIITHQIEICNKNLKQLHCIYSKEINSNKLPISL